MKEKWPKAIFYDSKKTLWDWSTVWTAACAKLLKKYHSDIDPAEFKKVWNFYHTYFNHMGAFGANNPFQWNQQRALMHAFRHFNIVGDPEDVSYMANAWKDVKPFPEVPEELKKQQKMCKVFTFSNIERYYLDLLISHTDGFKPDFVGDMVTAGCSKPNPRAYYWVLEQTGLKIDDVLYCACPQWDLQGALAIGMRTIWLNRDNEPLTGAQPEFIVSDLCGVTKVIESFINK